MMKSNSGRKEGVYLAYRLQSTGRESQSWNLYAGPETDTTESPAHWLAFHGSFSLFASITQDVCPGVALPVPGWALPHRSSGPSDRVIFSSEVLPKNNSSLCQVGRKSNQDSLAQGRCTVAPWLRCGRGTTLGPKGC